MVADLMIQSLGYHHISGKLQREHRLGPTSEHVVCHEFDPS